MAGMRLLGEIARNSGLNCSPLPMFDRMDAIGQARLLQEDRDLVSVGGGPVIEIDHGRLLP